ncbi:MAG: sodium/proline symporter [Cyanobacteria bacterium P01_G01_bin.54]
MAIILSFLAFLLLFTGVGVYSASRKSNTTTDYLLASRGVNPWLTGLSAFATAHSGGMFISVTGWTYQVGISSMWLLVGWFVGDYIAWFMVHKRLRILSQENQAETISSFLAPDRKAGRSIAIVSAGLIIVFLGAYAAAQLLAGSKALHVVFGWDYSWGILLGAVIVFAYCFSGGIRASIWTDAIQAIVMVVAMVLLLVVALKSCGGFGSLWQQLKAIDPTLTTVIPDNLQYGFALFLLSWLVAGFGVIGQPHIMVRAMVLDDAKNMGKTRNIYALLYLLFSTATILVGLTARVLLPDLLNAGDPELALPKLAIALLPAILVGVVLAGIFSAVISTADSQILACSAALTQDVFPRMARSYRLVKAGTLIVTVLIVVIALTNARSMFALQIFAWSALASSLGPILIVRVWRLPLKPQVGVSMMIGGIATAAIWSNVLQLSGSIYEVLPGMGAGFLIYGIAQFLNPLVSKSVDN